MVPLGGQRGTRNDRDASSSSYAPGGGVRSTTHAPDRHFDEAIEPPARHTNDDGSRTTSRALVGSETPEEEVDEEEEEQNK